MKNWLYSFMLIVVASTTFSAAADDTEIVLQDTVYFYETWEQVFTDSPVFAITPFIYSETPYELYFETNNARFNVMIEERYIAATLGDTTWLVNSNYLRKNFKGDAKKLNGYVPLFFDDRVAFAVYAGLNDNTSLKNILFGDFEGEVDYSDVVRYYYLDFLNHKVLKVDSPVLTDLLEDYHDLQMRYEGMKNNNRRTIIEDFFFKFVDRASQDIMRPRIIDLVN